MLSMQRDLALRHCLVGIDAPDLAALEPTLDALRLDAAPRAAAFEEMRDDARLGARDRPRSGIGIGVERAELAGDDHVAAPVIMRSCTQPSLPWGSRIFRQTSYSAST